MGGHFERRHQILKETLEAYQVPEDNQTAWLKHTDDLRPLITPETDSDCDPIVARARLSAITTDKIFHFSFLRQLFVT